MSDNTESQGAEEESVVVGVAEEGDNAGEDAPALERREAGGRNALKRAIFNVPIEVVVCVGAARPLIGDLLEMERNHLLPLDSAIDDPVELRVKDKVIARGELTQVPDTEGQLGVKVTEIVSMSGLVE